MSCVCLNKLPASEHQVIRGYLSKMCPVKVSHTDKILGSSVLHFYSPPDRIVNKDHPLRDDRAQVVIEMKHAVTHQVFLNLSASTVITVETAITHRW